MMAEKITLYVDGACRGNPGLGGWGVYKQTTQQAEYYCGGAVKTTNNRMELIASIQGILHCPSDAVLEIWTDSNYVKRGITEWIHGWKKKNWKDVKNPDLWQQLDHICQNRDITWHWVKGHAGHAGNEMADRLANRGADEIQRNPQQEGQVIPVYDMAGVMPVPSQPAPTPVATVTEPDWLLNDPFGFDDMPMIDDIAEQDYSEQEYLASLEQDERLLSSSEPMSEPSSDEQITQAPSAEPTAQGESPSPSKKKKKKKKRPQLTPEQVQQHIVITPATKNLHGERQLILDTETTGFYYHNGDRIIEVGAIEMIHRKLTGSSIHIYLYPDKEVGESVTVHGLTDEFLSDKPTFEQVADVLFNYLKGAEIIAHNATFDMNFLDMEFEKAGYPTLSSVCQVIDTLALAKAKHTGQRNSLDALVKRYEIPERDRTFHGALLDAEILADVYLAMTGGQVSLDIQDFHSGVLGQAGMIQYETVENQLKAIMPDESELEQHQQWLDNYFKKQKKPAIFHPEDVKLAYQEQKRLEEIERQKAEELAKQEELARKQAEELAKQQAEFANQTVSAQIEPSTGEELNTIEYHQVTINEPEITQALMEEASSELLVDESQHLPS